MKPVFFNGFDPVINNFLAPNKLQANFVFFKFILRVRNPKNFTSSAVRIAMSALMLLFLIIFKHVLSSFIDF